MGQELSWVLLSCGLVSILGTSHTDVCPLCWALPGLKEAVAAMRFS